MGSGGVDHRHGAVLLGLVVGALQHNLEDVPLRVSCVRAKGWNVVCRQLGPPGSDRITEMALTSCARQADLTRRLCRNKVMSNEPITTASATV